MAAGSMGPRAHGRRRSRPRVAGERVPLQPAESPSIGSEHVEPGGDERYGTDERNDDGNDVAAEHDAAEHDVAEHEDGPIGSRKAPTREGFARSGRALSRRVGGNAS